MTNIFKEGFLSQGEKKFQIVQSRDSCLLEGKHVVAILPGEGENLFNHQDLTREEMSAAFLELLNYCQQNAEGKKWKIVLNGPGLLKAPWFHIHGILPEGLLAQVLREVWRPTEHLERLKQFSEKLDPSLAEEFQSIVDNFENNLK